MRRLWLPLFAILIGSAPLAAASAPVVYPPGLRIGLEPAGELSVSRRFPGFEDAARQVAVTILDLPAAAFDQLSRSAFAPQTQELTDFKRESFSVCRRHRRSGQRHGANRRRRRAPLDS